MASTGLVATSGVHADDSPDPEDELCNDDVELFDTFVAVVLGNPTPPLLLYSRTIGSAIVTGFVDLNLSNLSSSLSMAFRRNLSLFMLAEVA